MRWTYRYQVHVGLPVTVWLWAINGRNRAALDGKLQMVSADRVVRTFKTGSAYYVARVEINSSPSNTSVELQLGSGCQCDDSDRCPDTVGVYKSTDSTLY